MRRRPWLVALLCLLVLPLLRFWDPWPLPSLRLAGYDLLQASHPLPKPSRDVVLVAIDDASVATIGPLPWPRDVHA